MITHLDRVHIEHPLPNPAAFCVASDEVLVCADDEQRVIIQVTSEKDEFLPAESPLNWFTTQQI